MTQKLAQEKKKYVKPRTFLVIVDDTHEMRVALHYACRRVRNGGGRVSLLYVQTPAEFQHWYSIGELMRTQSREEAENLLQKLAHEVLELSGKMPVLYLREGMRREEILSLLQEDKEISVLVLGASVGPKGPGPLVVELTSDFVSSVQLPITLVPGNLTPEQINLIA